MWGKEEGQRGSFLHRCSDTRVFTSFSRFLGDQVVTADVLFVEEPSHESVMCESGLKDLESFLGAALNNAVSDAGGSCSYSQLECSPLALTEQELSGVSATEAGSLVRSMAKYAINLVLPDRTTSALKIRNSIASGDALKDFTCMYMTYILSVSEVAGGENDVPSDYNVCSSSASDPSSSPSPELSWAYLLGSSSPPSPTASPTAPPPLFSSPPPPPPPTSPLPPPSPELAYACPSVPYGVLDESSVDPSVRTGGQGLERGIGAVDRRCGSAEAWLFPSFFPALFPLPPQDVVVTFTAVFPSMTPLAVCSRIEKYVSEFQASLCACGDEGWSQEQVVFEKHRQVVGSFSRKRARQRIAMGTKRVPLSSLGTPFHSIAALHACVQRTFRSQLRQTPKE